ncbi:MAG TPA: hypothetical protein VGP19_16190 [Candidatus Acidoferrales bacterium]|nr:hypothetical protein [Candidatus Acidoferrales bacterium]
MGDPNCTSQSAKEKPEDLARRLFAGALAICALVSIALYNGYPTLFSDTGSYLLTGKFFVALAPFRAPGYSIFVRVTSLGISAWFTIAMQAVMVVYVLYETCIYLVDSDRKFADRCFLASVCALAALTSLPWLVSLVMPDVFAGVLFLSAFLLAFAGELRRMQRIALAVILAISVAAHTSLFPIAGLFVVAVVVLRCISRTPRLLPSTRSVLAWLLIPIIASGFVTAELNREMGLGFRLSPSRNAFLLARLFGDGLAADFLRENCPQRHFLSCRYLRHLPRSQEEFLFQSPLFPELLKGHQNEMEDIVRGTLLADPVRFVTTSAKQTLLQLSALRTGDEIRSYSAIEWNNSVVPRVFPGDLKAFLNARQYRGRLTPLADASAALDTIVFWLSLVTCLLLAGTGRFARVNLFLFSAIAFLVMNATICASFAGVYDRYQSRVAWIIPYCLSAYIACRAKDWKLWENVEKIEELEAPAE